MAALGEEERGAHIIRTGSCEIPPDEFMAEDDPRRRTPLPPRPPPPTLTLDSLTLALEASIKSRLKDMLEKRQRWERPSLCTFAPPPRIRLWATPSPLQLPPPRCPPRPGATTEPRRRWTMKTSS